jgi:hypothetical protein
LASNPSPFGRGNGCISGSSIILGEPSRPARRLEKLQELLDAESINTLFASKRDRVLDHLVPIWNEGLANEYVTKQWFVPI